MKNTHKRIARTCSAVQWTDTDSRDKIIIILQEAGVEVSIWNNCGLILRFDDGRTNNIESMSLGDWCITGMDSKIRRYDDTTFNLKYQKI